MSKKIDEKLRSEINRVDLNLDGCRLADIVESVKTLITEYGEEATLVIDSDYDSGEDYSVFYWRPETEKEKQDRLARSERAKKSVAERKKKQAADKEVRDRKQYEKLKKQFEGK